MTFLSIFCRDNLILAIIDGPGIAKEISTGKHKFVFESPIHDKRTGQLLGAFYQEIPS